MAKELEYPTTTQTFEIIRGGGGILYIDKTDLIYKLTSSRGIRSYFLSRPRRFGKSLLISTLDAYFQGKKELFEGLAIEKLETEWKAYPVLHLDFSGKDYTQPNALNDRLQSMLKPYEAEYNVEVDNVNDFEGRFQRLILAAEAKKNLPVVILIDEYDKPLTETMDNDELHATIRNALHGFYEVIKLMDAHLRFVLVTGVTKFAQVSLFSGANNLKDISMTKDYATLCGITEREIHDNLAEGVAELAEEEGITVEECYAKLKKMYDGYKFSWQSPERLYNPLSLLKALDERRFDNYWIDTGTPTYLYRTLENRRVSQKEIDKWQMGQGELSRANAKTMSLTALLFQEGYLTIESYSGGPMGVFKLRFPNEEVRGAFFYGLLSIMFRTDVATNVQTFIDQLGCGRPEEFIKDLHSLFARGDYRIKGEAEFYFENVMLMFCVLIGLQAQAEHATNDGRIDLVVQLAAYVYVFELKLDKPAEEAMAQIEQKRYAAPFASDNREVIKLGLCFSSKTRNIKECIVRREGREDEKIKF